MPKEIYRYADIIHASQLEWQSWRARGLKSVTRLHQTIELPIKLASQYQNTLISALPIDHDIKSLLKEEHPPLIMGWALGPDDRTKASFKSNNKLRIDFPKSFSLKQAHDYFNGIMWINELITGQATIEAVRALHSRPLSTIEGSLSRIFLNPLFSQTDAKIIPKQLSELAAILQKPNTRINILNAWFSGDRSYANRIMQKETNMNTTEFTLKMGRAHRYTKISQRNNEKNTDGGEYQLSRGVAYLRGNWPWFYTIATTLPLTLTKTVNMVDIPSIVLITVFDTVFAGILALLNQIPPSLLAHETIHYLSEGQNRTGWYRMYSSRED